MLLREFNIKEAQEVWREEGWQDGRLEEKYENARNMKAEGLDLHLIARITGLSFDEVLNV